MFGDSTPRRNRLASVAAILLSSGMVGCGSSGSDTTPDFGSDRFDGERTATEALFAPLDAGGPGCSAAVNVDGEIQWSNAYGLASIPDDEPFDTETIVDIGSASKPFTATAIALAVADGSLDLDDPIDTHLGGLPDWAADVTIRDLVQHTSGVPDYIDLLDAQGVDLLDDADQTDALDALTGTELEFEPGTSFRYSNSNYILLAELIATIGDDDLAAYLAARVFDPLDLEAEMAPGSMSEGKAESYERHDGWVVADSPWTQQGDGAIQTTPEQLALWATEYWEPELAGLEELRAEPGADMGDGGFYGLGIMEFPGDGTNGGSILTHAGGWSGFDTGFVIDPGQRTAVAVTCNSPDAAVTGDVADEILAIWTS